MTTEQPKKRLELSDGAYGAREKLEKLLRLVAEGRLTGEAYLKIVVNQGGVRKVTLSLPEIE